MYIPRWLPLVYLAHKRMPTWLVDWLSLIPVAEDQSSHTHSPGLVHAHNLRQRFPSR